MRKEEVLKIIDEVMNNREIDSIRNAILAIRDKVIEHEDCAENPYYGGRFDLRRGGEMHCTMPYFEGAKFFCVNTMEKIDTGMYGAFWYE